MNLSTALRKIRGCGNEAAAQVVLEYYVAQEKAWLLKAWQEIECGYNCNYYGNYGFVPEAGCPVHDTPLLMNS